MSTFTASLHNPTVKEIVPGLQAVSSKAAIRTTGTAASSVLLAKVPNGAIIKSLTFYAKDGGADQTWKIGIQQPEGSTSGSVTVSKSALSSAMSNTGAAGITSIGLGGKLPYKVSISSEATPNWAWVIATASAALSASADLTFVVNYEMDCNSTM